jgi:hypothetical protein
LPAALVALACPWSEARGPVYDAAYYEDLAGRPYGLVIRLGGRLTAYEARWLRHVTEVGEYGLALGDMAKILAHDKSAITGQERGDMLALAERMKSGGGAVRRAPESCPRAETPDPGGEHS